MVVSAPFALLNDPGHATALRVGKSVALLFRVDQADIGPRILKGATLPTAVGVLRETFPGERRVAITPRQCEQLRKLGADVIIESAAGAEAGFPDDLYVARGARFGDRQNVFEQADVIAQVRCLGANPEAGRADLPMIRPDQVFIGFNEPLTALKEDVKLAETGASVFALELMPRTTRAQSMDVLSFATATVAGYRAVLLAAMAYCPRCFR